MREERVTENAPLQVVHHDGVPAHTHLLQGAHNIPSRTQRQQRKWTGFYKRTIMEMIQK